MLLNYDAQAIAEIMGLALHVDDDPVRDHIAGGRRPEGRPEASGRRQPGPAVDRVSPASSTSIEQAVSAGLPRTALRHVAETLAGSDKARISLLERDVVPKTTLDRRKGRLSVGESERTERIARLFVHARRALGSDDEAREFMTTSHPQLESRSPLDVAATDLGTRRAEQILNALEYGLAL